MLTFSLKEIERNNSGYVITAELPSGENEFLHLGVNAVCPYLEKLAKKNKTIDEDVRVVFSSYSGDEVRNMAFAVTG